MPKKDEYKIMTDSNIHPPEGTDVDIKDPQPIPGIEVTQAPGLVPEEIAQTDYLAPETTHPYGFKPDSANVTAAVGDPDGGVNTSQGYVPANTSGVGGYDADVQIGLDDAASTYEDDAHHELMSNPHYAVHVHESQLNRIVEVLEEIASKLNDLEYRLESLEESVRFEQGETDGPPEPPSGIDYSTGGYGGTAA